METLVMHGADGREIQRPLSCCGGSATPWKSALAQHEGDDRFFHGSGIS